MIQWRIMAILFVALSCCAFADEPPAVPGSVTPITPFTGQDRILILSPHPDDEVLGCAGIIQKAVALKIPVRIIFLTYGDNNEWSFMVYRHKPVLAPAEMRQMGMIRHDEAVDADTFLGVPAQQLIFLGYPDFGTLTIWDDHWQDTPPYRSMMTRVTEVPYPNAYRPGAPYTGESILSDLEANLRDFKPTRIFVSHPADHMPDHRAFYLFLRVALWDLSREMSPQVYPYLVHYWGWPQPRGYHPELALTPPDLFKNEIAWQMSTVAPAELDQKYAAIQRHHTQFLYSGDYLSSFCRSPELFGDFPATVLVHEMNNVPKKPDQLTQGEKAGFVGLEDREAVLDGDAVVLHVRLSRPMGDAVETWIDAFGYRQDRPFAEMPKLTIKFGNVRHRVYDRGRLLDSSLIPMQRTARDITIRIPLDLLGVPEKILTSSRTLLGNVPLDWASWRVLDVPPSALADAN